MAKARAKPKKKVAKKATAKRKGVKRTPPFEQWPDWSEAQFWSFVRSGIRSKFQRYPPHFAVLEAAKRPSQSDNKRLKFEYQCAECKHWFPRTKVSDDHIVACGSLKCYADLPGFVERMAVGVAGRQVLCLPCHATKTAQDKLENNIE